MIKENQDLEISRQKINQIDMAMAKLFEKRMHIVKDIADYKLKHSLSVKNAQREAEILSNCQYYLEDDNLKTYYHNFLKNILYISVDYQNQLIAKAQLKAAASTAPADCSPLSDKSILKTTNIAEINHLRIPVHSVQRNYEIVFGENTLKTIAYEIDTSTKVLIVSDNKIPQIYIDTLMAQCKDSVLLRLESGEKNKSFKQYKKIIQTLIQQHFTRNNAIIALGGGMIGDLAGFAAATYMRGIRFYNIPTSLAAQVDAAVGGKTAINFSYFKNMVGAFYPPEKVIIDPLLLKTLSPRERNAGLAEVIKMAATFNKNLFERLKSQSIDENMMQIIKESLAIKIKIVEEDEKEKNLRKVLNFGHTVGHAIESQSSYLHGECVGMGMLYFCSSEVRYELITLLKRFDLPLKTDLSSHALYTYILHDKKIEDAAVDIIYVPKIGSYKIIKMPLTSLKTYLQKTKQQIIFDLTQEEDKI